MFDHDPDETIDFIRPPSNTAEVPHRVFLMLSYDTVFKPSLLYDLLLRRGEQVCGVAEVRAPKKKKPAKQPNNKLGRFGVWGWKGAVWFGLWTVFNKLRSALPFPSIIRSTSTIKRVAKLFDVPYYLVDDVNSNEFLNQLQQLAPDVVVSFQHQIFRQRLLELPKIACINCHPAKLPEYRGNQPLFWALADGRETFGVTVHTMTQEIDGGEILAQVESPIRKDWTLADHYRAAYTLSADAIVEAIDRVGDFECVTLPIDSSARYYKRPTQSDLARFNQSGRVAI